MRAEISRKCRPRRFPELFCQTPRSRHPPIGGSGGSAHGPDELAGHWTLLKDEQELVAGKRGPTRLGFAVLLKFYARARRFPRGRAELDDDAVAFVARQLGVPASDLGIYEWAARSSTTGHTSAATWGSGNAPPRTPASSPSGWPSPSARPSGGPTGCGRNCWPTAAVRRRGQHRSPGREGHAAGVRRVLQDGLGPGYLRPADRVVLPALLPADQRLGHQLLPAVRAH